MNKKAFVLTLFVVIATLTVLLAGSISLYSKQHKFGGNIGEGDAKLIETYTNAEKALFYLDQAARLTAHEAFEQLIQNPETSCGTSFGVQLWTTAYKKCYPETIKDYKRIYSIILREKLITYNRVTYSGLAESLPLEYELTIPDKMNKIIGTALLKLYYEDKANGIYYKLKPNFKAELNFDLSIIDDAISIAKDILTECKNMKEPEFKTCAERTLNKEWLIGTPCATDKDNDGIVPLCRTLKTKNPFTNENFILKFAVTVSQEALTGTCCSPESAVSGINCKTNSINAFWALPQDCKRISTTQDFLDKIPGQICCLS